MLVHSVDEEDDDGWFWGYLRCYVLRRAGSSGSRRRQRTSDMVAGQTAPSGGSMVSSARQRGGEFRHNGDVTRDGTRGKYLPWPGSQEYKASGMRVH
jgi:hypothetical protein